MPGADTNFKIAVENAIRNNPICIMTINDTDYILKSGNDFYMGKETRLGFSNSAIINKNQNDSRWVIPDAYFILQKNGEADHYIFVEQCCNWQNFYQKRFVYDGGRLILYRREGEGRNHFYTKYHPIEIDHVLFILNEDRIEKNAIDSGPVMSKEIYSFTYGKWKDPEQADILGTKFCAKKWFGQLYRRLSNNCKMRKIEKS